MRLFCRHDFRPYSIVAGQSLLGDAFGNDPIWAVDLRCIRCNRRRLDKGYTEAGARAKLRWLRDQYGCSGA